MSQLGRLLLLVLVAVLIGGMTVPPAFATGQPNNNNISGPPTPQAKAALLMDASSGRVLFEKNGQKCLPPASLTKIMTALLVVESGDLDKVVVISDNAAQTPECTIYLQKGENLMRRNLLYAAMLNSANDAATALAESVAGSEEEFIRLMNQRAEQLGMVNSHFRNPHGLQASGHETTAYDLALLTRQALKYPEFREVVRTESKVIDWAHHQDRYLFNQNRLLYRYNGAIGVKTGYTRQAGNCVTGAAERDGLTLVAVALNSPCVYEDLAQMLDYGFNNYAVNEIEIDGMLEPFSVNQGTTDTVAVGPAESLEVALAAGERSSLQVDVVPFASLHAPIEVGDVVGSIQLRLKGAVIAQSDLLALDSIAVTPVRPQSLKLAWRNYVIAMSRWHLYNLLILVALGYYTFSKKRNRPYGVYHRPVQ